MNGSPAKMGTISGTAGHSSALKMKAEADAASALKQMYSPEEMAKKAGRDDASHSKKGGGQHASSDRARPAIVMTVSLHVRGNADDDDAAEDTAVAPMYAE